MIYFSLIGLIFILGLMIGSFLNVVIYRIPKNESIVLPASHCTHCNTPLKWYHNIPLISWIFLAGKCAFCKTPISKQYPIIETITGIVFVLLYLKLGIVWYFPFVAFSFATLIALMMIDFKYMIAYDTVNYTALILALIQPNFFWALLYAVLTAGGLYIVGRFSSFIAGRPAMGGADVIVAATMGALLGFPGVAIALFLAAILGIIPSLYDRYWSVDKGVPFIPFLALATLIVFLYDTQCIQLMENLIYD